MLAFTKITRDILDIEGRGFRICKTMKTIGNYPLQSEVAIQLQWLATHPEAIRARDCAMAIRCNAGRLSPVRLERGGRGAAHAAAPDEDTGPRTRAEGEGVQVEATVEMSGGPGAGSAQEAEREEEVEEWGREAGPHKGVVEGGAGGGGGGGKGGGGGRVEEMDRVAVAEPRREREWAKLPPTPKPALPRPPPPKIPIPPAPPIPPKPIPPAAPPMGVLWGENVRDMDGGRGRVSE